MSANVIRNIFGVAEAIIISIGIIKLVTYKAVLSFRRQCVGFTLVVILVVFLTLLSYQSLTIKTVVFLLLTCTAVTIIYKVSFERCFFFTICMLYIIFVTDLVIGNASAQIFGTDIKDLLDYDNIRWITISICGKVLQMILTVTLIILFPKTTWKLPRKYWFLLDIMFLVTYIITAAFAIINPWLQDIIPPAVLAVFTLTHFLVSLLTIYLFGRVAAFFIDSHDKYVYETSIDALKKEISQFESSKNEMHAYQHDWQKNLNTIGSFLVSGKIDDALSIISSLTDSMPVLEVRLYCGISILDAILTKKAEQSEHNATVLEIRIDNAVEPQIDTIDICNVVSNLLDNAIEAVAKLDHGHRRVLFQYFNRGQVLHIITRNPHNRKLVCQDGILVTTKANAELHGWGIGIVEAICKKYHGNLHIDYSGSEFIAHAQLVDKI